MPCHPDRVRRNYLTKYDFGRAMSAVTPKYTHIAVGYMMTEDGLKWFQREQEIPITFVVDPFRSNSDRS